MSPAQGRAVYVGTLNPEQAHSIYDEYPAAFVGAVDAGLNPSPGIASMYRSGAAGVDYAASLHTAGLSGAKSELRRIVRAETATPKTETLLMIVTGLGLVAFQMRRVQRLLHHRPFSG
jgi:hypothetical protein